MKISQQQVADDIQLLVELGGIYKVDNEYNIRSTKDNELIEVQGGKKKENYPITIFHPGMVSDNKRYILNPFTESLTSLTELQWFWDSRSGMISNITNRMVTSIPGLCCYGKEDDHSVSLDDLLSQFSDVVDRKTEDMMLQLNPESVLKMVYHRVSKTAYLKTDIYDEDFRSQFKKFRKKDWQFLEKFMEVVGLNDLEPFKYKGQRIGLIECEARLNVLTMFCQTVNPAAYLILDVDLKPADLERITDQLKEYHKACIWFHSASAQEDSEESGNTNMPPWKQKSEVPAPSQNNTLSTQGSQQSVPAQQVPDQNQNITVAPSGQSAVNTDDSVIPMSQVQSPGVPVHLTNNGGMNPNWQNPYVNVGGGQNMPGYSPYPQFGPQYPQAQQYPQPQQYPQIGGGLPDSIRPPQ